VEKIALAVVWSGRRKLFYKVFKPGFVADVEDSKDLGPVGFMPGLHIWDLVGSLLNILDPADTCDRINISWNNKAHVLNIFGVLFVQTDEVFQLFLAKRDLQFFLLWVAGQSDCIDCPLNASSDVLDFYKVGNRTWGDVSSEDQGSILQRSQEKARVWVKALCVLDHKAGYIDGKLVVLDIDPVPVVWHRFYVTLAQFLGIHHQLGVLESLVNIMPHHWSNHYIGLSWGLHDFSRVLPAQKQVVAHQRLDKPFQVHRF